MFFSDAQVQLNDYLCEVLQKKQNIKASKLLCIFSILKMEEVVFEFQHHSAIERRFDMHNR